MKRDLELYVRLERVMLDMDRDGDPLADPIRDLMDPIWLRLSSREIALLDARGAVESAALFPVQLPPPPTADPIAGPTVTKEQFTNSDVGWQSPDDWKAAA
jgi:hypothetical protein